MRKGREEERKGKERQEEEKEKKGKERGQRKGERKGRERRGEESLLINSGMEVVNVFNSVENLRLSLLLSVRIMLYCHMHNMELR